MISFISMRRLTTYVVLTFLASSLAATTVAANPDVIPSEKELWHIKAIHPDGKFLDVVAIDAQGNMYPVKALEVADNRHVMDIKALVGDHSDEMLPVKIIRSENPYMPVKAIGPRGEIYDVKALTRDNVKLDIKGIGRSGSIIHIKAISQYGLLFGVKAISPSGKMHDVKGVKMSDDDVETTVHGVQVFAHIKALPPPTNIDQEQIWTIRVIHRSGDSYPVKAIGPQGHHLEVRAIYHNGNSHVMQVLAMSEEETYPVVLLDDEDGNPVMCAITKSGEILPVQGVKPTGEVCKISGVVTKGNLMHIKFIDDQGTIHGVKAVSRSGMLYDVKGVKMYNTPIESQVNGIDFRAWVRALPQVQ